MRETIAMIATVGGQPQVVTFALDTLLAQGVPVSEVYVVHLSSDNRRIHHSLQVLAREFHEDRYAGAPCRYRRVPILRNGQPLREIQNASDADVVWQTIRSLMVDLKEQGRTLHICVAGGRRMVALLTISAAALLCDHRDRLWHLYTPDEFQETAHDGARMHATDSDGVVLVQVPMAPWGTYFPALRALAQTPSQVVAQQFAWLRAADDILCRQVYSQLTERQRDVLHAFAAGLRPQEVAEQLSVSLATVNTHKTAILALCRTVWEIPEATPLDYHFMRERFAGFVELNALT
jgi:CRISPR-associated protein Csx14